MSTTITRNGLVWNKRTTPYGHAYDLDGSPSGSCGYTELEIEPTGKPSRARRPFVLAMLTMATTAVIVTLLIL